MNSNTAPRVFPIEQLPVELLGNIADFLPRPSFLALRLASRTLLAKTSDKFNDIYCSPLKVKLTIRNLQTVSGMLDHPDVASDIKEVIFVDHTEEYRVSQFPDLANGVQIDDDRLYDAMSEVLSKLTATTMIIMKTKMDAHPFAFPDRVTDAFAPKPSAAIAQTLRALAATPTPSLTHLEIAKNINLNIHDLRLLLQSNNNIKHLELAHIFLHGGNWSDFLIALGDTSKLASLKLNSLRLTGSVNLLGCLCYGLNTNRGLRNSKTGRLEWYAIRGSCSSMFGEEAVREGAGAMLGMIGG